MAVDSFENVCTSLARIINILYVVKFMDKNPDLFSVNRGINARVVQYFCGSDCSCALPFKCVYLMCVYRTLKEKVP